MKYYIYFLIHRRKVVYVGQTKRFTFRISAHTDKTFNEVRRIECPIEKLAYYEKRWIDKFKPVYNKGNNVNYNRSRIVPVEWTTVSVRLRDKKLFPRIIEVAEKDNRSVNNLIEKILKENLDETERKATLYVF